MRATPTRPARIPIAASMPLLRQRPPAWSLPSDVAAPVAATVACDVELCSVISEVGAIEEVVIDCAVVPEGDTEGELIDIDDTAIVVLVAELAVELLIVLVGVVLKTFPANVIGFPLASCGSSVQATAETITKFPRITVPSWLCRQVPQASALLP